MGKNSSKELLRKEIQFEVGVEQQEGEDQVMAVIIIIVIMLLEIVMIQEDHMI